MASPSNYLSHSSHIHFFSGRAFLWKLKLSSIRRRYTCYDLFKTPWKVSASRNERSRLQQFLCPWDENCSTAVFVVLLKRNFRIRLMQVSPIYHLTSVYLSATVAESFDLPKLCTLYSEERIPCDSLNRLSYPTLLFHFTNSFRCDLWISPKRNRSNYHSAIFGFLRFLIDSISNESLYDLAFTRF